MANNTIVLPNGQVITLVDREQLRFKNRKQMSYSPLIEGFLKQPTPPATFDLSKGRSIKYPILGNDSYGDCFYAAVCHQAQTYTGNSGIECSFDVRAVTQRYLHLSGGDNGLDDGTILPEFKSGIVGPNGPRKIFDDVQVDPTDDVAVSLACWAFGGLLWTCSLLNTWMNTGPGSVWTNNGRPNPNAGHAMHISGKTEKGWQVETWGMDPPVTVTSAGVRAADSEFLVCFSMDLFNPQGFAPCGLHYLDLSPLWQSIGGHAPPTNPFPEPDPGLLTYVF